VLFKLRLSQTSNRDVILASHTYANACSVIVYKYYRKSLSFEPELFVKFVRSVGPIYAWRGVGVMYVVVVYVDGVRLRLRTAVANGSSLSWIYVYGAPVE
jgi:hypothetical protein